MPVRYDIKHTTIYRYRQPVPVRRAPRDVPAARQPRPARARDRPRRQARGVGAHDPGPALELGRARAAAHATATTLEIVCSFRIEHAHSNNLELPLSKSAELYPFAYALDERLDLEHYLRPNHDDPDGELTAWARQFIRTDGPTGTRELLVAMNQHIREHLRYQGRDEEGTQSPLETLRLGSGSCRDFALLMMEAARRLGFATRFVTGYLYDPALDGGAERRHARRRATRTPGCRPTCRARAGCRSIRPTTCSAGRSSSAWRSRATRRRRRRSRGAGSVRATTIWE